MRYHSIALILIFLYVSPYFYLGADSFLTVLDNMDSIFAYAKILWQSGFMHASGADLIPSLFNGYPRVGLPTDLNLHSFLITIFPPVYAYAILLLFSRVVAYFGMNLLIRLTVKEAPAFVCFMVSICFALLPFWPMSQLCVAGLPILFWSLIRLSRNQGRWIDWLVLGITPFATSLFTTHIFVLFSFTIWGLVCTYRDRKIPRQLVLGLFEMSLLYIFIEHRLFREALWPTFIPHRIEFVLPSIRKDEIISSFLSILLRSHYHAESLPRFLNITWVIAGLALIYHRQKNVKFLFSSMMVLGICIFYAIWKSELTLALREQISLFGLLDLSRFFWLLPPLVFVLFAVSSTILWNMNKYGKLLVISLFVSQLIVSVQRHEQLQQMRNGYTYNGFYSEDLFKEIHNYIGNSVDTYRVMSVGLHPILTAWNGFYNLDFYSAFYPLEYKREFRKIIAPELEKNKVLRDYFDKWGNRVYAFSSELGMNFLPKKETSIEKIDYNFDQFKKMGGEYILSGVRIQKPSSRMKWIRAFEAPNSPWKIDLYRVE